MREDTDIFNLHNNEISKRLRVVIEVSFDTANTILWYFTSHADAALPGGGGLISSVISGFSGTSQTLHPDDANSEIGSIDFQVVDKDGDLTATLGDQLELGRSTRLQRVRVYIGYEGDVWADYIPVQTQLMWEIAYRKGTYFFSCKDIQREMRKDIFDLAINTLFAPLARIELTAACSAAATTLEVGNTDLFPTSGSGIILDNLNNNDLFTWSGKTATQLTGCSGVLAHNIGALVCDAEVQVSFDHAGFEMTPHGTGYTDAPSATVGYLKIQDEVIRYTGKTGSVAPFKFTGCQPGALNTKAVAHPVDITQPADRRLQVEEYVYLEGPAISLLYQVLTGKDRFGAAALPTSWNMGIPTEYVGLSEFTGIGADLWDLTDELAGLPARFEDLDKEDGKQFVEHELALLAGVFMPVRADGALGCRRMAAIKRGSAGVVVLNESNSLVVDSLRHVFSSLHNIFRIFWNWVPLRQTFSQRNLYIDGPSITIYKKAGRPLSLEFRGLHGSRHTAAMLRTRFDFLRDRYSGPPEVMGVEILGRFNGLEVGDVVRCRMRTVRDINALSTDSITVDDVVYPRALDRAFEVQNITIDWVKQRVKVLLFGSSREATPIHQGDSGLIPQSYYEGSGTELSTVPGIVITGSNPGRVTTGVTLTGGSTMAAGTYYYIGDLQIDDPIFITQNVFLKVFGHLTNNVEINGVAAGIAGAAAAADPPATEFTRNKGTSGFLGNTSSGGGLIDFIGSGVFFTGLVISTTPGTLKGSHEAMPPLDIRWTGTDLDGLPTDLRGTSGSSGMPVGLTAVGLKPGGAGGNGGAALMVLSRGFSQGGSGSVKLSGGDGQAGGIYTHVASQGTVFLQAGSGAGGAPGGFLVLVDGAASVATDLGQGNVVQVNGATPIQPSPVDAPEFNWFPGADPHLYSYYTGFSDPPDLSGDVRGGTRAQYVLNTSAPVEELPAATLPQPSSLALVSGTAELLGPLSDGTIITRVKVTWGIVNDARVAGYDVQFKKSSDVAWQFAPSVIGASTNVTWVVGVQDGVNYDFRVRAAGSLREVSEWTTETDFPVLGKLEKPADVGALVFNDVLLSWPANTDLDHRGYVVRYQPSWASTDWDTATPAHTAGFITETQFDTSKLVGGQVTMLVKQIDTTGNLSTNVSSKQIDLRPPAPDFFTVTRQPDGTRELDWSTASPPSDLAGVEVRYKLGTATGWDDMTPLHDGLLTAAPFESNQLAAGTYDFAVKNVDEAGNLSANATFILSLTIGDPRIAGAIDSFREEPNWTETKTNCIVDGATGWLVASGSGTWNDIPTTWDAWNSWIVTPSGSMQYERKIDVGAVATFIPLVTVVADAAGGSVTIEEAHSDDDITYSSFAAVGPELTCRYIKIRVTVTGTFPKLKSEVIILSATPIEEIIENVVPSALTGSYRIGTGDIRLPIVESYNVIKKVDIAFQSVTAGDVWTWSLEDKDTTVGPHVKLYKGGTLADPPAIDAHVIGV